MYGFIEWTEEKRRIAASERMILRLRFCCVSIPRRSGTPRYLLRRRAAAAARVLQRAGIRRAVFPADFSWAEEFESRGIQPVDPLVLHRAMAAELVQARLRGMGQTGRGVTVAVCAGRLTEEVRRTVTELCIRNRYVTLSAGERDDVLCRRLRREYGVPLVQSNDPAQLAKADVVVRFSPERECREEQETLDLFSGGAPLREELRLPPELEERLPDGCDRLQLLTALYVGGAVRVGEIQAVWLDLAEKAASFNGKG